MSRFNFIASDTELPEVNLTNVRKMTVRELKQLNPALKPAPQGGITIDALDENDEVLYFETEADLGERDVCICAD